MCAYPTLKFLDLLPKTQLFFIWPDFRALAQLWEVENHAYMRFFAYLNRWGVLKIL